MVLSGQVMAYLLAFAPVAAWVTMSTRLFVPASDESNWPVAVSVSSSSPTRSPLFQEAVRVASGFPSYFLSLAVTTGDTGFTLATKGTLSSMESL